MELDRTNVETEAGTYRIVEHYDEDTFGSPLTEFDHPGMSFAVFQSGRHETLNNLAGDVGSAVQSWINHGYDDQDIERRFGIWKAITGDETELVTYEAWADRGTWYRCFVLVELDEDFPDWDRKDSALATMREFEAWLRGEVYGYLVEGPDGVHIDSCWGFIGDQSRRDMIDQARDHIEYDAKQRLDQANKVGAGFVGII